MLPKGIDLLLVKFLCDSADSHDLDVLNDWIKDQKHDRAFKEHVKTYFAITISMNELDKKEIKQKLFKEIRKDRNVFFQKRTRAFLRYAALFVILLGIGFVFQNNYFAKQETPAPKIIPHSDQITLQLDNGETKVLEMDANGNIQSSEGDVVGTQNGNTLKYENAAQKEIVYNTLKVPNAKRFNLVLSDGTRIHLNSGSTLRYPVSFIPGKKRKVFLEGEAFLDVAHDKDHPFVVNVHDLNVEVLGTRFNLSDYGENSDTEVVLVDGRVSLEALQSPDNTNDKMYLEPGFKGSFNRSTKYMSKAKVNTSLYTSWIDGRIVMRNEPFENILIKLQRYYNVTIINNNKSIARERFNATIETDKETIEQVLNYFRQVYQIDYNVVENKVVIN